MYRSFERELVPGHHVTLSNCDREAVHTPGEIQNFGTLVVLAGDEHRAVYVADNCREFLPVGPQEILGRSLAEAIEQLPLAWIESLCRKEGVYRKLELAQSNPLVGCIRRSENYLLLELERDSSDHKATHEFDGISHLIEQLETAKSAEECAEFACAALRKAVQCDCAIFFRFDDLFNGEVIAESHNEKVSSYRNHFFTNQDIPVPARRVMHRRPVGIVADYAYVPVVLRGVNGSPCSEEIDLTHCSVRSVSRFCRNYYLNMGIRAGAVCRSLNGEHLWGFFSLWQVEPRIWTLDERRFLLTVSNLFDTYRNALLTRQSEMVFSQLLEPAAYRGSPVVSSQLVGVFSDLAKKLEADGFVCKFGTLDLIEQGAVPPSSTVVAFSQKLQESTNAYLFSTRSLSSHFPDLFSAADEIAGVLVFFFGAQREQFLMLFRRRIVPQVASLDRRQLAVASDSNEDERQRLNPEASFQIWQEEMRAHSLEWQPWQLKAAELCLRGLGQLFLSYSIGSELELSRANVQATRQLAEAKSMESFGVVFSALAYNVGGLITDSIKDLAHSKVLNRRIVNILEEKQIFASLSESFKQQVEHLERAERTLASAREPIDLAFKSFRENDFIYGRREPFVPLSKAIQKAIDVSSAAGSAIVRFEVELSPDSLEIHVPEISFAEVIKHIIENAHEAILEVHARRDKALISISSVLQDGNLRINVQDTGPGIEGASIYKIFIPLFTTKSTGRGLGLSRVMFLMAEKFQGTCDVTSRVGEGTVFTLQFPCKVLEDLLDRKEQ